MICGERIHDDEGLEITSIDAARISKAYCLLEGKVKSFYVDDNLGDHARRRFRVLSQRVKKLEALRIHWVQASPEESKFSVNHFSNLIYLQLENCPLSSIIGSFYLYREKLKKLDISGSDGLDLCRLLLPWRADKNTESLSIPPSVSHISGNEFFPDPKLCWLSLTTLRITNCALNKLDISLHYLPAVTEIEFSHNNLSQIIHLQDCGKLNILDLSHNRIQVLSNISRVLGNLSSLYISHNQVRSLDGIDKLYSLRTFDVSFNLIDNFSELQYLTKLPYLESLHLIGNPISRPSTKSTVRTPRIILKKIAIVIYRKLVFKSLLADGNILGAGRDLPHLDHHPISTAHKQSLRGLSFKNLDIRERITSHFIADLRKSPVSNMNVHNKWSTSSCHSSSSKLSTLATATTFRNSSDAGSSRNNSPTNISGTWSNSCRSFDTFDSEVEDEFVRRRRGSNVVRRLASLDEADPEYVTLEQLKENIVIARNNRE